MAPISLWLWFRDEKGVIIVLWEVVVAGGLTVMTLYGLDRYLELEMRNLEAREENKLRKNGPQS